MAEPRLLVEQSGRVLTVQFNNLPRNFFDEQMSIELDDLTRRLERDSSIGAVVFTGRDTYMTHFSVPDLLGGSRLVPFAIPFAGARLIAAGGRIACRSRRLERALRQTPARDLLLSPRIYASLARMNRMDKVFVVAINGLAFGMGCVFALACDIRLMADGYPIGLVESAIAVLAGAGGTQRLVRTLGSGRALELLLEGRWMTPTEAVEIGLVHRVVAPEHLQAEALITAQRLARRSPVVNREIKRMVYDAGTRRLPTGARMEAASMIVTVTSSDARQSMDAYLRELEKHDVLTDDAIRESWLPLLKRGVPRRVDTDRSRRATGADGEPN